MVCAVTGEQERESTLPVWSLPVMGSFAAIAASRVTCDLASTHTWLHSHLFTAALCVAGSAFAGAAAAWVLSLGNDRSTLRTEVVLTKAAFGWIWMPAVLLLMRRDSIGAVWMAAATAVMMALALRGVIFPDIIVSSTEVEALPQLFAETLRSEPWNWQALGIVVCLYGGAFAIRSRWLMVASFLLGVAAFALTWQLVPATKKKTAWADSAWKLAGATVLAVLITTVMFQPTLGSALFAHAWDKTVGPVDRSPDSPAAKNATQSLAQGPAYTGIILWPVRPKKKIVLPVLSRGASAGLRLAKPLIIPFDGPYWYFEATHKWPGARAHVAHGDPTGVNISTNDRLPLVMEAHQSLDTAIELSRCEKIQLTVQNRDYRPGRIALRIVLTDSANRAKPSLYLGAETMSPQAAESPLQNWPDEEVLTFPIRATGKLRQFDEITVLFLRDVGPSTLGPKVAIRQFELVPRSIH